MKKRKDGQRIVCVLTGNILKDSDANMRLENVHEIEATIADVQVEDLEFVNPAYLRTLTDVDADRAVQDALSGLARDCGATLRK